MLKTLYFYACVTDADICANTDFLYLGGRKLLFAVLQLLVFVVRRSREAS